MRPMTIAQADVLDAIQNHIALTDSAPTLDETARDCMVERSGIPSIVKGLVRRVELVLSAPVKGGGRRENSYGARLRLAEER